MNSLSPEPNPNLELDTEPSDREWEALEWKRSFAERDEIGVSISAFANRHGGEVKVGIDDRTGEHLGVQIGKGTIEAFLNQLYQRFEPVPVLSVTRRTVAEGLDVLTVKVSESPLKPVRFAGTAYVRVGRTNRRMSLEEEHQLYSLTRARSWDSISSGVPIGEVSRRQVEAFQELLARRSRERGGALARGDAWLSTLGLVEGAHLTFAGVLCLTDRPQDYLPAAETRCARFSSSASVDFADLDVIEGSVFGQIEGALAFIRKSVTTEVRILGSRATRQERPDLSLIAAREAITNALCHREYSSGAHTQVRIFPDRVEVWNPGTLLPPLTVRDLYRDHESVARNQRLAQVLFHAGLIEQFGTGTLRMLADCESLALPLPRFEESDGRFRVRLERRPIHERFVIEALNPRQRAVIRQLSDAGGTITVAELQGLFGISRLTATSDLKVLFEGGFVNRRRSGHGFVYFLTVQ